MRPALLLLVLVAACASGAEAPEATTTPTKTSGGPACGTPEWLQLRDAIDAYVPVECARQEAWMCEAAKNVARDFAACDAIFGKSYEGCTGDREPTDLIAIAPRRLKGSVRYGLNVAHSSSGWKVECSYSWDVK